MFQHQTYYKWHLTRHFPHLPEGWVFRSKCSLRTSRAWGVKEVRRFRFFDGSLPMNSDKFCMPFLYRSSASDIHRSSTGLIFWALLGVMSSFSNLAVERLGRMMHTIKMTAVMVLVYYFQLKYSSSYANRNWTVLHTCMLQMGKISNNYGKLLRKTDLKSKVYKRWPFLTLNHMLLGKLPKMKFLVPAHVHWVTVNIMVEKLSWDITAMTAHWSWKTTYSWWKDLIFAITHHTYNHIACTHVQNQTWRYSHICSKDHLHMKTTCL